VFFGGRHPLDGSNAGFYRTLLRRWPGRLQSAIKTIKRIKTIKNMYSVRDRRSDTVPKNLERDLGLYATITISIGAMIGSGIFVLPGLATTIAGPAAVLA
jgi:amino acid permease